MAKSAPTGPTILAFAPGTWRWPDVCGSTRYHLWTLAKRGWQVLYVDPPNKLRLFSSNWKAPDRDFHVLSPGRVTPFGVRGVKGEASGEKWRESTSSQMTSRALKECARLGLKPDVYWFGAPWHSLIAEKLPKGPATAYHAYDELSQSPILDELQRDLCWRWERELVRHCDVTLCSSMPQRERRIEIAKRAFLLENAVSEDFIYRFEPYPADEVTRVFAARMEALAPPRFVYGGVADLRLDCQYFREILSAIPSGNIIFLGKQDESLDPEFARDAESDPRIHFFGEIPYHCYPSLYRLADVLLIAHKRLPFTDAMYPEKLNEYLATGRPVVSVTLPEVGRVSRESVHEGVIRTADSPSDFVVACTIAMNDKSEILEEKRVEIAKNHTWGAMAERLERELRMEMGKRGR